jgi:hypothetical protein
MLAIKMLIPFVVAPFVVAPLQRLVEQHVPTIPDDEQVYVPDPVP